MGYDRSRATGAGAAVVGLILAAALCAGGVRAEGLNLESAKEFRFEVGGGISKYRAREDGVWWQSNPELLTKNDFRSFGYQIGMRWPNVRLSFVNLGHYHGDNQWVSDEGSQHTPLNCAANWQDCRWNGKISGNAYGLSLGPVVEKNIAGLRVELEGGLFLFRSNQSTNICPMDGQNAECFTYNRMWGMHRTWYVGAGIARGPWSLNYRVYQNVYEQGDDQNGKGGDIGMTGGATQTLFVTYAFN